MDESFSTDSSNATPEPFLGSDSIEHTADRDILRVILISSRRGVTMTIQNLHRVGFAQVGEWSPILPAPNPGDVMSILTRNLPKN